ncbi:hypothetical protein AB0K89_02125 [Streptomyces cinnamoneus]|uniref:hypothetical protein n=1 Tax=Streptomyces cinnamoneus TaxID=53446 RepID=UPI00342C86C2
MTSSPGQAAACRNPVCPNPVRPATGSGRPRKYCSDACRKAYYKSSTTRTPPDAERHDGYVQQILEDLCRRAERLLDLAHADRTGLTGAASLRSQSMSLLKGTADLGKDLQDLEHAVVQQARDRGIKVVEIAQARNVSEDKVRRDWPANGIDRRMKQRKQRHSTPTPTELLNELPGLYLPGEELDTWAGGQYDSTEGPPTRRAGRQPVVKGINRRPVPSRSALRPRRLATHTPPAAPPPSTSTGNWAARQHGRPWRAPRRESLSRVYGAVLDKRLAVARHTRRGRREAGHPCASVTSALCLCRRNRALPAVWPSR